MPHTNKNDDLDSPSQPLPALINTDKGEEGCENHKHSKRLPIDYIIYPIYAAIIFTPAFAEIYSNYYKLTRLNSSFSDFKWPNMSTNLIYTLLAINLIFAAYMVIRGNISTIKKEWSGEKNSYKLIESFSKTIRDLSIGILIDFFNFKNEKAKRKKTFGRFLVIGNSAFYVSTMLLSSYNDLIVDWGFNHSTAKALAILCGIGALIGGITFSKEKVESTIPHIAKILADKSEKRKWLFGLLLINLAGAGFSYKFSKDAFSHIATLSNQPLVCTILAIVNSILLTLTMILVSLHALYAPEIKSAEEGREFQSEASGTQPLREAQKRWRENSRIGKCFFFMFALISLINLSTAAASGGFGWESTLSSSFKGGLSADAVKYLSMGAFFMASIFVGIGRFFFAHVVENTIKMDKDRENVTQGIKTSVNSLKLKIFDYHKNITENTLEGTITFESVPSQSQSFV
jgi:hypothetical protein